jgi:hypothetical protein
VADDEFVYMTHSGTEAVGGPVTKQAYEQVWKDKGWKTTEVDFRDGPNGEQIPVARSAAKAKG